MNVMSHLLLLLLLCFFFPCLLLLLFDPFSLRLLLGLLCSQFTLLCFIAAASSSAWIALCTTSY